MKWTKEQETELRELCFKEKTNAEIAAALGCDVKDIHAKRSQLGITRDKVKAVKQATAPDNAASATNSAKAPLSDPWVPIGAGFDQLDASLLSASIMDHVNAPVLRQTAAGVSVLKSLLLTAIQ